MTISDRETCTDTAPLIDFALRGLANCWMPDGQGQGLFSYSYSLDEQSAGNRSQHNHDAFNTLNVLLGFSQLTNNSNYDAALAYDIPGIFEKAAGALPQVTGRSVPPYTFGMALWAGAELQLPLPGPCHAAVDALLEDETRWQTFTAQDTAMLLSGCIAQARLETRPWSNRAERLHSFIRTHFDCPQSGLFFNNVQGYRRRFSSFATMTYMSLALLHYSEWRGHEDSIKRALRVDP